MKNIALLISLLFLQGCATSSAPAIIDGTTPISELGKVRFKKNALGIRSNCTLSAVYDQKAVLLFKSKSAFSDHDSIRLPKGMYMIESTCGDYPTVVFSTIPVEIKANEETILNYRSISKDSLDNVEKEKIIAIDVQEKHWFHYFEVERRQVE